VFAPFGYDLFSFRASESVAGSTMLTAIEGSHIKQRFYTSIPDLIAGSADTVPHESLKYARHSKCQYMKCKMNP
jgi:hypothetical protein